MLWALSMIAPGLAQPTLGVRLTQAPDGVALALVTGPAGTTVTFLAAPERRTCTSEIGLACVGLPGALPVGALLVAEDGRGVAELVFPDVAVGRTVVVQGIATSPERSGRASARVAVSGVLTVEVGDEDADGDFVSSSAEATRGTDPALADSDGGGVIDGIELALGTDPLNGADDPSFDFADRGPAPADLHPDSDGDGLTDTYEIGTSHTHPRNPDTDADTDGDGRSDGLEVWLGTDPQVADSGDTRVDTDGDGIEDDLEIRFGTDPLLADTDGDGVYDGAEFAAGRDPRRAEVSHTLDTDGDGLPDAIESALGSDPTVADTDGDGYDDGVEIVWGTDPADPLVHP